MSEQTINVVLSGDNNYAKYMAVTIKNIVDVHPKETQLNFLILDCGIENDNIEKLHLLCSEIENVHLHCKDITKDFSEEITLVSQYQHGNKKNIITAGAYALFFVAEAFPQFDKAFYIDVDVIVTGSLQQAYNTQLENHYAAVVRMLSHAQLGVLKSSRLGKPFPESFYELFGKSSDNYFNNGVQLLNLAVMREEKVKDQLVKTLTDFSVEDFKAKINYHNQDIFNAVFCDRVKFLPTRYNCQVKNLNKIKRKFLRLGMNFSEFQTEFENPKIIHYSGNRKPWNDKNLFASELWWSAAKHTPFYAEISEKYKADINKRLKTAKGIFSYLFDFRLLKNQRHIRLFGISLLKDQ